MEAMMERPSHIIFDTQPHYYSRRLPLIGLAISMQLATLWLFAHGFSDYRFRELIPDIQVIPVPKEENKEATKPPEPVLTKPKPVIVDKPIIAFDPDPGGKGGIHADGEQKPTTVAVTPAVPDRGAISIASTHTVPPYPPIARRIGVEGKVTLRLTVSAEGKVIAAEVVSSSGRDDMDQTAQQWIMAHWAYRPALDNGVPVIGHVLASVNFSLINQR
jgi:protein TonB